MRLITTVLLSLLLALPFNAFSQPDNGLVTIRSAHDVTTTIDRLETLLQEKGVTIVTRWRHDERANAVDIPLRPTELLIFGNPKLGSHLMTSQQTAGIDLPLKALAWEDANGKVWISYNDPAYLVQRHGIADREKVQTKMTGVLTKLVGKAAAD